MDPVPPGPGDSNPSPGPSPTSPDTGPAPAEPLPTTPAPPPRKSALAFFAVLLLLFLPALVAQAVSTAGGLLWSELVVFLLPAFTFAAASNLQPKAFLRLVPPPRGALVGLGALAGGACFLVGTAVMAITQRVLPEPWVRQFDLSKLFDGPLHERLLLAGVAALVAPVCEEITFRGYVLSALALRRRAWVAIAGSTVLFSLMHLDPVRLPALVLLGAVFGWLSWRSGSVWPSVAAHAANNGVSAALALAAGAARAQAIDAEPPPALVAQLLAFGAVALGLVLAAFHRAAPAPPPGPEATVRRADPSDPGHGFSLRRVPGSHWAAYAAAVAVLGAGVSIAVARGGLLEAARRASRAAPVAPSPVSPPDPRDRR